MSGLSDHGIKMPRRPRSHVQESESRTEFARLIGTEGWVIRPADSPDYGVDDFVEVFEDDLATGLYFFTQARSTDKDLSEALDVRIREEQQNYFRGLEAPVLIVRYHAPSGRTFAKWFHHHDPWPRQTSTTVKLDKSDELREGEVSRLASEVVRFRELRSATASWPIPAVVESQVGFSERELAIRAAEIVGDDQQVITLIRSDRAEKVGTHLLIQSLDDRLVVSAGAASHTFHGDIDEGGAAVAAAYAVLGAGFVLATLGHSAQSAVLLERAVPAHPFPQETVDAAAELLAAGNHMATATRIAREFVGSTDPRALGRGMLLVAGVASAVGGDVPTDTYRDAASVCSEIAERLRDSEPALAAAAHLQAGRILFGKIGAWDEARTQLEQAAELDPTHTERLDFLLDLGGARFEAGDFEGSIDAYRQVIERWPDERRPYALLGDALMQLGHFAEADVRLREYLAFDRLDDPIWILTAQAAELLARAPGDTNRDPDGARSHLQNIGQLAPPGQDEACRRAVSSDPLCADAWVLLGDQAVAKGEHERSVAPYLVAALQTRAPETWAKLTLAFFRTQNLTLLRCAATYAQSRFWVKFVASLAILVRDDADGDQLLDLIEEDGSETS